MLRVALVLRSTDVHPVYFDLSTDEHATGVPPYPSAPRGEAAVFFFRFSVLSVRSSVRSFFGEKGVGGHPGSMFGPWDP